MASSLPLLDCARTSGQRASGVNVLAGICHASHQAFEGGTKPFIGGSGRRAEADTRPAVPKMLRARRHFSKKRRFRRLAINPTPPKRDKTWGDGSLRLEDAG